MSFYKIVMLLLAFSIKAGTQVSNFCRISEPANVNIVRTQVYDYINSGSYIKDIRCIADQARAYLDTISKVTPDMVVVFDIDETIISNWAHNKQHQFIYHKDLLKAWEESAAAPAIEPMRELFHYVLKRGFTIVIITGRGPHTRGYTLKNLENDGYYGWKALVFRPHGYHGPNAFYKAEVRRLIERRGYTIVANFGDQESDLAGGHARKTFKLPNPMYYLP